MTEIVLGYFPNLSDTQRKQFKILAHSFPEWNNKINLVSRKDMDEFQERHVLHSLAIYKAMKFAPGSRILDVGTGGGLPGIPLAILMPEVNFVLCDSTGKKIKVVHALVDEIDIREVERVNSQGESKPALTGYLPKSDIPTGCGGDDKAGVFICLQLLDKFQEIKIFFPIIFSRAFLVASPLHCL